MPRDFLSCGLRSKIKNRRYSKNSACFFKFTTMNRLRQISATCSCPGFPPVWDSTYKQDYRMVFNNATGNMTSRQDYLRSKLESFTYDTGLDRLLTVTGPQNLTMNYTLTQAYDLCFALQKQKAICPFGGKRQVATRLLSGQRQPWARVAAAQANLK